MPLLAALLAGIELNPQKLKRRRAESPAVASRSSVFRPEQQIGSSWSRGAGRSRTAEWRFCRPLPYHLATAPKERGDGRLATGSPPKSGKRDSNPRPQPWQGCALPAELFPQVTGGSHGNLPDSAEVSSRTPSRSINFKLGTARRGVKPVPRVCAPVFPNPTPPLDFLPLFAAACGARPPAPDN